MEQIFKILEFIFKSFLHIWPYLLVTIPLAVVINLSGASKYITSAFGKNPLLSVFLATVVGAFSPFCSCGVIPVISSLLIGGVPLAPVMSFWIASPSMDPEIFFLSSSMIGWKLAVWRLASTFAISLLAGYLTHFATIKGFISNNVLKTSGQKRTQTSLKPFMNPIKLIFTGKQASIELCCAATADGESILKVTEVAVQSEMNGCNCNDSSRIGQKSPWQRVLEEIFKATLMVTKFMGIAFLITALITLYLPKDLITRMVSGNPVNQVILSTLIGIPMYTSNITALPIANSLLALGINEGAVLAFLIGGATTTLPAMVAVFGITKRRVFLLYFSFAFFGALLAGLCYNLFN
jgi:uncharacterized membrane protein YraQ (UPF0718 family)